MKVMRKGATILPAAMGILGSIMVIGFASSTRSAATNRYLDAARARRVLSVVSRSVASEASFVLEQLLEKEIGKGRTKVRSAKLHQGGKPRTVEVPLTSKQFEASRVKIGPVTAVFSELKRHWDKKRDRDKGGKFKPQEEEDEFPKGNGVPGKSEDGEKEEEPPDKEAEAEDEAFKPKKEGEDPDFDTGDENEKDKDDEQREGVYNQEAPGGESGAGGEGGGGKGKGGKGKGKWRRRGAWGLVQLKFDVTVETQGAPYKRRIAIRRFVMVRKWAWHPMRIDVLDVARSQEAVQ